MGTSQRKRKTMITVDEKTEWLMVHYNADLYTSTTPEWILDNRDLMLEASEHELALNEVIKQAMAQLTPLEQAILRLRFYNDGADAYTAQEIADKLGVSVRTYYYALKRAFEALRDWLQHQPIIELYYETQVRQDDMCQS